MPRVPDSGTIAKRITVGCALLFASSAFGAGVPATVAPTAIFASIGSGGSIELWLVLMLTLLGVARWLECEADSKEANQPDRSADDAADHRRV